MKKGILFMAFVAILIMPFVYCAETWADCGSDCANKCAHHGSGKDYAACMENCLKGCLDNDPPEVPPVPEPKPVTPSEKSSKNKNMIILAQNENYVACYKDVDMKPVLFRWCPTGKPWTPTNENRNFCYATSEACANAEMPQSWCIKCENRSEK